MGPLDMKGLLGAATVVDTLMYGAGHVWKDQAHFYLHDGELSSAPPDETHPHAPTELQSNWSAFTLGDCGGTARLSRITTRFGGCTSLLWTCGGLGSTTLHEPRQSLINCGIFLIVMPRTA